MSTSRANTTVITTQKINKSILISDFNPSNSNPIYITKITPQSEGFCFFLKIKMANKVFCKLLEERLKDVGFPDSLLIMDEYAIKPNCIFISEFFPHLTFEEKHMMFWSILSIDPTTKYNENNETLKQVKTKYKKLYLERKPNEIPVLKHFKDNHSIKSKKINVALTENLSAETLPAGSPDTQILTRSTENLPMQIETEYTTTTTTTISTLSTTTNENTGSIFNSGITLMRSPAPLRIVNQQNVSATTPRPYGFLPPSNGYSTP